MTITIWAGVRHAQGGRRVFLSWDELCDWLSPCPPPLFQGEDGQEGWSPATFLGDHRTKANIEAVYHLTLEHDSGSITLDLALAILRNRGWSAILITTKSHTPERHRWRLVIRLSRPVTADERERLYHFATTLGLDLAVAESRDPSRFWFTTCRGEHDSSGVAIRLDGAPLGVDAVLASIAASPPPSSPAQERPAILEPATPGDGTSGYVRKALESAYEAIAQAGKGARHTVLSKEAFNLGGLVGGGHLSRREAEHVLFAACDAAWPDPRERAEKDRDGYRTARGQLAAGEAKPRTVEAPKRRLQPVTSPAHSNDPSAQPTVTPIPGSHLRPVTAAHIPDVRPAIWVRKGDIPTMTDAAIKALAQAEGDLYTREGELVHVANVASEDEDGFPVGAPKLYTLSAPGLTERLARAAQWLKDSSPVDPPTPVVQAVMARRYWPSLRQIAGIVQAPTLRPDGSLMTSRGYDPSTRMLYIPSETWPDLPAEPTRQDANNALCALFDAFEDFPWENEDGIYVAIAATLTVVARPAIEGAVPVFVFDANSPGSGKTLVADTISTIATGREAGRHSYPSDPKGSNEEVAKVLTGYAIGGAQVLCWDNLSPDNVFGGPALESVSTARNTASFRILGKSENITLPWRTVMLATGNNVAITRDLERRSLVPRFVARWETADSRPIETFRHPERFGRLLSWARAERVNLVSAALTLLRAYVLAGHPSMGLRWASFEEWTDLIPSAIVWAGGRSPLSCRPADTGRVSPEREALAVILRDWPKVDPEGTGASLRSVITTLYPDRHPQAGPQPPDGLDELRDAIEVLAPPRGGRVDSTKLSGAFRRLRQVSVGGRALEAVSGRAGSVRWTVR